MSTRLDTLSWQGRREAGSPARMSAPHFHGLDGFVAWVSDLARQHTRALAAVARAEGLTAEDALDAVQDAFGTFLDLAAARDAVGKAEDSRRLLAAIVRNAARNMRRRAFRRLPHDGLADQPEIADDGPGADELLVRAEAAGRLEGCVARLSEVQQRVVRLRILEELSGADVARELAVRPDHVATLLHRAKKELCRCVAGSPAGDGVPTRQATLR
jgi:RNA polymerase sigma-70 factor (ECF subfamily)